MHPVVKWVDDFLFFRAPVANANSSMVFPYAELDIYSVALTLGWAWKPSKTCPFSTCFCYIGFDWDIPRRYVSIPVEKHLKFVSKIASWSSRPTATLKDIESLLGSLIHCALAIPEGRSRIVGLARFTAAFSHAHHDRFNTRTRTVRATDNAMGWSKRLDCSDCGSVICAPPPMIDLACFMDMTTPYGIGIIIGARYSMWQLTDAWAGNGHDIGWAEMVAIELVLSVVTSRGIKAASVLFRSDNQDVIGAIRAGRSSNDQQNLVLQRIVEHAATYNVHLQVEYITTNENPGDAPSQGIPPAGLRAFDTLPKLDSGLVPLLTDCSSR
jgi:hypothetical protein